jgi:hypothetical protein
MIIEDTYVFPSEEVALAFQVGNFVQQGPFD